MPQPQPYALIRIEPHLDLGESAYPDYLLPFAWINDKTRPLIRRLISTAEPAAYAERLEHLHDYPVAVLFEGVNAPVAQDLRQMHVIRNDLNTLVDAGLLSQQHAEQTFGWGL